ncbi:S24 family peptidase [Shewanella sp. UCD-KL12]|uniref:S24 family peptidase n=1 Tax=Shewanella sp. UCD-KL12 TaxID=1917163 RepID=UPI000970F09C
MRSPTSTTTPIHGFESPAKDYAVKRLCLDDILIEKSGSTYITIMSDDQMNQIGLYKNDLVILDSDLTPKEADIVCVLLNGQLKCRMLALHPKALKPCHSSNPTLEFIEEFDDLIIVGVVTRTVRCFRKLNTSIFD